MARTVIRKISKPEPTFTRSFNYRDGVIGKTATGEQFVKFADGTFQAITGKEEGAKLVDSRHTPEPVRNSRRRTGTVPQETSGPYGPYMKNPPPECNHKKVDSCGIWAENVVCVHICKDVGCITHIKLLQGTKERSKQARGY